MNQKFEIGDRVKYNHRFLKSIGGDYEASKMMGTVKEIKGKFGNGILLKIKWDGNDEIYGCLDINLAKYTEKSGLIDNTI